jgi:hypothetical protein
MPKMGLQFGLEGNGKFCKRQFRWLFYIPDCVADETAQERGANALPPEKSARPSLSFKEMDVKHLNEDVYYAAKPDWKPITITVYDLEVKPHPVFNWIKKIYDPKVGTFKEPNSPDFIKECRLTLYNGCGLEVETWVFEECWPQQVNFQTLDMGSNGICMCEITLRYFRAYIN